MDSGEENDDGGAPVVSWLREDGRPMQRSTTNSGVATARALASRNGGAKQTEVLGAPVTAGEHGEFVCLHEKFQKAHQRVRTDKRKGRRAKGGAGTRCFGRRRRNTAAGSTDSGEQIHRPGAQ